MAVLPLRALPVPPRSLAPLGAAAAALAVAGLALWVVALALPAAPPPARSPFGVGVTEAGGAGGLLAWSTALQAEYGRRLTEALARLRADGGGAWLVGLSLLYGVLHAVGPGHGKAVVAAYVLANGADLRRGIAVSAAAALVQAGVALALVLGLEGVAAVGPDGFRRAAGGVEAAGFLAMAAYGAWLLGRKATALCAGASAHACGPGCGHGHDHVHAPRGGLRAGAAAALVGGLRPCSGAILVLVLALSQGLYAAGVASVLAMALGTAATTSAVAAASVYAKALALRLGGGRPGSGARLLLAAESVAAALVALLGLLLALGAAGPAGAAFGA